jgi:hypothetical protein
MIKFNKNTLTELAGLGAGAATSAYVKQKLLTKADGSSVFGEGATSGILTDVAPVAVGLFLQGQKGIFLKEAGKGMIAESIGGLIKKNLPLGITGADTLLGEVEMASDMGDDRPMMGYSSSAYDDTSADAGEMDF